MVRQLGAGATRRLKVSDFNERVTILRYTKVADGYGGFGKGYESYGERYAAIRPYDVQEEYEGKQPGYEIAYEIIIRRDPRILNNWRVSWVDQDYGRRTMKVVATKDLDAERRFTIIFVTENLKVST